jgi:hypothetical protein
MPKISTSEGASYEPGHEPDGWVKPVPDPAAEHEPEPEAEPAPAAPKPAAAPKKADSA